MAEKVPPEPRPSLGWRELDFKAELHRGAATGVQPPKVNGKLAGDCDDRFLALRPGGPRAFGQQRQTLFDRRILGLEAHHPPGALDQGSPQSGIAALGHTAWNSFAAAGVFSRAEPGVAADRAPVTKAIPVTDLAAEGDGGEFAQPGWDVRGCSGFELDGQRSDLLIQGEENRPVELQVRHDPLRQKFDQPVPGLCFPPMGRCGQTVAHQQSTPLSFDLLSMMNQLLALAGSVSRLFFLFAW